MKINRIKQFMTIALILIFVMGFFYSPIGMWTGIILATWFIGTQKIGRGYLLFILIQFVLTVLFCWQPSLPLEFQYIGKEIPLIILGSLPFMLYRWTIYHRHTMVFTLTLPFWGVAWVAIEHILFHTTTNPTILFLTYWFGSLVLWIWNRKFQDNRIQFILGLFIAACLLVMGTVKLYLHTILPVHQIVTPSDFVWVCAAGGVLITGGTILLLGKKSTSWSDKQDIISLLRSPYTGESLQFQAENRQEFLVSQSKEHFPIFKGIPDFLKKEELTGSNQKYNQLYEVIGGFYDDTQRVTCGIRGVSMEQYHMSYLRALECKKGDRILETSVGTGLNFKVLPNDVKLFGLDLAREMLINCQTNLERWNLKADLCIGNAESLPFADNSFDVVFHVGGINFFNDRKKAIQEMIRVAKPGSRILIADETEEYVKKTYERIPYTRSFFKNRKEKVTAPLDLVPLEMLEIKIDLLFKGGFYAITFRKP